MHVGGQYQSLCLSQMFDKHIPTTSYNDKLITLAMLSCTARSPQDSASLITYIECASHTPISCTKSAKCCVVRTHSTLHVSAAAARSCSCCSSSSLLFVCDQCRCARKVVDNNSDTMLEVSHLFERGFIVNTVNISSGTIVVMTCSVIAYLLQCQHDVAQALASF